MQNQIIEQDGCFQLIKHFITLNVMYLKRILNV